MTLDAHEIACKLSYSAESVASHLFPQGKKQAHEWCVGSLDGEPGASLKIHLTGRKAGVWADFATGEGGDLLKLWVKARGLSMVEALKQAKEFLGISDASFEKMPRKAYQRPKKPQCVKPQAAVMDYLTVTRKIPVSTLTAFQVGEEGRKMVFPFKRDGELIGWKKIGIDLKPDGKKDVITSAGSEPCLFGWQAVPNDASEVFITEGEIDAMTVHSWGYPAMSVPFGGGGGNKQQWIDNDFEALQRFATIYLCLDHDEQGELAKREIVARLGAHRCKIVDLLYFKDANEALLAGMGAEFFADCVNDAHYLDPQELKPAHVFEKQVLDLFFPRAGVPTGLPLALDRMNRFCFRPSELTIWTGINGHGKSMLLGQIMLDAVAAEQRVCIASMELPGARTLYRLVRQATAMREPSPAYINETMAWLGENLWIFDVLGSAKTDRILEVFRYAARRYGIQHFVIDSLMKCGIASDDYRAQKSFVEALCDFKSEYGVHVHLVAHPRKGESESAKPDKMDVKGAGEVIDMADSILSVFRNKKKEEEVEKDDPDERLMNSPDSILTCHKQRNGEWEGKIGLWFDKDSFRYTPGSNLTPRRYVQYADSR